MVRASLIVEGARRDVLWAIAHGDRVIGGRITDRGAAEKLAPTVQAALAEAGVKAADLDHVIAGVGPGSYAGLRIVLAFCKGVVHASDHAQLVAVPSLPAILRELDEAVARGVIDKPKATPVVLMNAFAGQVFACGDGVPADCYTPADLNTKLGADPSRWLGVLDGDLPMRDQLRVGATIDLRVIPGGDVPYGVLAIGRERIARGELADVMTLLPDYGRLSSAELKANLG